MRHGAGLVTLAVVFAASAAPAAAIDRFVSKSATVDNPTCLAAQPCLTVQGALNAALPGDTVHIGPGVFVEHAATNTPVTIAGAGATGVQHTTLQSDDAINPALLLSDGGSVSAVHIAANGATPLRLTTPPVAAPTIAYDVHDVALTGGPFNGACGTPDLLVLPSGGVPAQPITASVRNVTDVGAGAGGLWFFGLAVQVTVDHATIDSECPNESGVSLQGGADGTISNTTVTGTVGDAFNMFGGPAANPIDPANVDATLDHDTANVFGQGASVELGHVTVVDSLVSGSSGLFVESLGNVNGNASATIRNSTLFARGALGAVGLDLVAQGGMRTATAAVTNSILRAVPVDATSLPAFDVVLDHVAASATIDHSSFTTTQFANGALATSLPVSTTNIAGDPLLADPLNGDFRLQAASPLIDRGDPAAVAPGETDLAGNPRSADGNGDCTATPDIGAFEALALPCPPVIVLPMGDTTPPVLSSLSFSPSTFRVAVAKAAAVRTTKPKSHPRGSKLKATVNEAGTLAVTLVRCVNSSCKTTKAAGSLRFTIRKGANSLAFSGRVGKHALSPGRYRATATAIDAAKNVSKPRSATFRIVTR